MGYCLFLSWPLGYLGTFPRPRELEASTELGVQGIQGILLDLHGGGMLHSTGICGLSHGGLSSRDNRDNGSPH